VNTTTHAAACQAGHVNGSSVPAERFLPEIRIPCAQLFTRLYTAINHGVDKHNKYMLSMNIDNYQFSVYLNARPV
jgi:hypothetical protein